MSSVFLCAVRMGGAFFILKRVLFFNTFYVLSFVALEYRISIKMRLSDFAPHILGNCYAKHGSFSPFRPSTASRSLLLRCTNLRFVCYNLQASCSLPPKCRRQFAGRLFLILYNLRHYPCFPVRQHGNKTAVIRHK